jgi:hypothetical protein
MRHTLRACVIGALVAATLFAQSIPTLQAQQPQATPTPAPLETPLPTLPPQTIRPLESPGASDPTSMLVLVGILVVPLVVVALAGVLVWWWLGRAAPREARPYLELEATGKKFYLRHATQILGRAADCQLRVAANLPGADTVSLRHARVYARGARWVVADGEHDDLRSLNGITVNGKPTLENYLHDGDVMTFGEMKFRFHLPAAPNVSSGDSR